MRTLSVDTADLQNGSYNILLDSSMELELLETSLSGVHYMGASEDIYGQATLIVPEPTTISLLGLTAVCVIRRRRIPSRPGTPG